MITAVTTDFGSNPSLGTQQWFDQVKRSGYSGFATSVNRWASTEFWPDCGRFLGMALTAGLWVGVYCRYPEGWENGVNGLGEALASRLRFFVLDVEPEADGVHPVKDEHVEGLAASNQRPMIYTNAGMWVPSMGYDPGTHFAQVALWDRALRPKQPNGMRVSPLVSFSGWNDRFTTRRIWQWADGTAVAGVPCTLNVVDSRWI